MKIKLFEPNILPISVSLGILGGILLMVFMALQTIFPLKGYYGILIYPLVIIAALMIYKRKGDSNMNYFKAFVISFIVFSMTTITGVVFSKIMNANGNEISLSFAFIVFLRLLGIGILCSLVAAALFFRRKFK